MSSFKFLFFGWLFASQKTGFSGFRYRFIPSLRFGTGYASPYNPCHCLKLKNSKLNLLEFFKNKTTECVNSIYKRSLNSFCKKRYAWSIYTADSIKNPIISISKKQNANLHFFWPNTIEFVQIP